MSDMKIAGHIQRANDNLAFLRTIDIDRYPDWVAISAFYSGLHVVEAILIHEGKLGADSHASRHDLLASPEMSKYRAVYLNYKELYNASRLARYGINRDGSSQFSAKWNPKSVSAKLVSMNLLGGVVVSARKLCGFESLAPTPARTPADTN